MELRHLRYFLAVAEELHFGHAAQRLQIAQPPLSRQIHDLEEELGATLFSRQNRKISLTPAGTVFQEKARHILGEVDEACRLAQKAHRGELGRLAIGFAGIATFSVMPRLIPAYQALYPSMELSLVQLGTSEQLRDIEAGKLHLGLLCLPIDAPDVCCHIVNQEPYMIALPASHPLAFQPGPLALSELSQENFIMTSRAVGKGYFDLTLRQCHQAGFSPTITQEVHELQTTVTFVAAGMGVALVPEGMGHSQARGVRFRPLTNAEPVLHTAIAWLKANTTPELQHFVSLAKKLFPADHRGMM